MSVMDLPTARFGAARAGGCGCTEAREGGLERLRYFQRQLLSADDMTVEQDYFREKLRRHNRFLHGFGVVCGLEVTAAPTDEKPWRVKVGPGYALSPQGDEIDVAEAAYLDLAECGPDATTDPCDPGLLHGRPARGNTVYVAVKYAECLARPVRGAVSCGCDDTSCEYSRVRDSFELACLEQFPLSHIRGARDLCAEGAIVNCPTEHADPWIVLARVKLPGSPEVEVAEANVDNVRLQLHSTWSIQQQVIRCCCGPKDDAPTPMPRPVQVATVTPANGTSFGGVGPAEVAIVFDKDVQAATVSTATVLVESPDGKGPLPGTVTYDAAARTARFRPAKPFKTPGQYVVRVVGAGASHVTDLDTLALDGDKNGVGGDDFKSTFQVNPVA
jgi:hypothetical protein